MRRACQPPPIRDKKLNHDTLTAARRFFSRLLERICENHGSKPAGMIDPSVVRKLRDELDGHAANHRLKALRALFKWAVEARLMRINPALGVDRVKVTSKGYHTWTEDEIALFEARHPVGTIPRLAMALLLYTACRREDVIRLGPQHIRNSRIAYTQAKNEHIKPVRLNFPAHPELLRIISATKLSGLTFLTAELTQQRFKLSNFAQRFTDWCTEAGIRHCSPHGLRKAAATRLAEAGCTPHEIAAVTGHSTLREIERYTKAVEQSRMADAAMAKILPPKPPVGGKSQKAV
jgi:integrase